MSAAESLPLGVRPNEGEPDTTEAAVSGWWQTPLGLALARARAEYLAAHGRFQTADEFERDWQRERDPRADDE